MKLTTIDTADGPFTLLAEDGVVLASGWTGDPEVILARLRPAERPDTVEAADLDDAEVAGPTDAVRRYYAGDLAAIDDVPVRQAGSDWRLRGWRQLREIPPGHPLSYAAFAEVLGSPTAVRAAASICATNAPALFVPCHRVLRGDGTMGGFAWGVEVKRSLLARERAAVPVQR
ncbi:MAG: methylated-DNA--[protein]-cysteine S-methyltransferase [Propionicimonas sp.]|uniref:methylated-DNA--[protein]-cysteine S-methyltransferase n=1 Tax=Propionicimonas sp. TaxID=1955623 RepID=UPI003D1477A2